jgi:hypothetical protein
MSTVQEQYAQLQKSLNEATQNASKKWNGGLFTGMTSSGGNQDQYGQYAVADAEKRKKASELSQFEEANKQELFGHEQKLATEGLVKGYELASQKDDPSDTEFLAAMMKDYNGLKTTLNDQITQISNTDLGVDVNGLVGEINANFQNTKNRITDSALTSVAKAGVQLDAYLGSPTGDQRSAARFSMAASVTNNMMQTAFQTIAGLYDKNTQEIVNAQLEGAKINNQAVATKAGAIASFTGQATQAYLGTLGALNDNYIARLNSSTQFAQMYLDASKVDIATQLTKDTASLSAMTSLLTSDNYGIKGVMKYGAPTADVARISSVPADTTYSKGSIAKL